MKTLALGLILAGALAAQDEEKKTESKPVVPLTDAEAGTLGGFVAEKLDATPAADEFERAVLGRIEEIRKARGATVEKKEEPAPAKGKEARKAARRAARKKKSAPASDVLKNGLVESDRQALGKFAVQEGDGGRKGQELLDAAKKELERLRQERVKASTADSSQPKRKKKKKGNE